MVNAVFFFFFFLVLTAFTERSKKRRLAGFKNQRKDKPGAKTAAEPDAAGDEEAESGRFKGRRNPNTSRRKTARRRRR